MDLAFEFLIPFESQLSSIKFEQTVFEWQGEKFPQGPESCELYYFKLIRSDVPAHVLQILPSDFRSIQWHCIAVIDGLESFVNDISDVTSISSGKEKLMNLLDSLTEFEEKWVLVFEPGYDRLDEIFEGDVNIAFHKIIDSLTVMENGFIIWFNNINNTNLRID
ncbi:MAG TPA: hypothetical protein VGF79_11740 [Bacteroidia bacterium]